MRFAKGHGTENDFVILVDPDGSQGLTAGLAARLCDRRAGIGADGVLRAVHAQAMDGPAGPPAGAEWFMDYRNADGSVAEMCGNGIRVFARYLAGRGLVRDTEFSVLTRSGARRVKLENGGVTVDMGPATVLGAGTAVVAGRRCEGLAISVGNPHLACLVDRPLSEFDLAEQPSLDPRQFPQGGNVELIQVTGAGSAELRVHERGSGETHSCGTGAVAAAVAAARSVGSNRGTWRLEVAGGQLVVTLEDATTWLHGPAVIVAEGELDQAWLAAGGA
jgi:diaminopimelate epimerase